MTKTLLTTAALGLLLLSAAGPALAQNRGDELAALRHAKQVQLGRFIFRSPALSLDDSISCASCHKVEHAFADVRAEPEGILGTGGGRNSPTLVGVKHVRFFPGVAKMGNNRPLVAEALTLAQRCLAPIENPLEMGSSIEVAVKKLRAIEGMKERFNEAFGPSMMGVTEERMGEALATFLETLDVPETRFHAFLSGDHDALDNLERRGYRRFVGAGCAECHRGESLSDGLVHPVFLPGSERARKQQERAVEIAQRASRNRFDRQVEFPRRGLARDLFDAVTRVPSQGGCDAMATAPAARRLRRQHSGRDHRRVRTLRSGTSPRPVPTSGTAARASSTPRSPATSRS
ncbi:MAG: cytochrome-c peroxidase [Planctomycetota bacterium]